MTPRTVLDLRLIGKTLPWNYLFAGFRTLFKHVFEDSASDAPGLFRGTDDGHGFGVKHAEKWLFPDM